MRKDRCFQKTHPSVRFLTLALVGVFLTGQLSWSATVIPPAGIVPLNQVAIPQPPNLFQFVKDTNAAIRLGKSLFWDMQVGSDGATTCATCHFRAGVDPRTKNTLHPGPDGIFQAPTPTPGANQTLNPADFPFHETQNPNSLSSAVIRDINDVVGSQGVRKADFVGIVPGSAVDDSVPVSDPIFNDPVTHANVRQVTDRNTPSNINAVFNFVNFHDGRAHFIFNGSSPFGPADANAGIWMHDPVGTSLLKQQVSIEFASLASQAMGPPVSEVEMSAAGRTFPEIGRKMLSLTPLGKQQVHPGDSVLGPLSRATKQADGTITGPNGLSVTYPQMIQAAFQNNLWNSPQTVTLTTVGGPVTFTQMEANFSLFLGLAIQLYETTLVSGQSPFDRWLGGDNLALTDEQKQGFAIFQGVGGCTGCHGFSELTNASISSIGFINNNENAAIELMFVSDGTQVIYDNGFNNTGLTRTTDDLGRGRTAPFLNPLDVGPDGLNQPFPLDFSSLSELQALGKLPFSTPILPIIGPIIIPPDFPVNKDGLFKVPSLRNVELTAPYFHNGGVATLEDVVEFYVRGGNFPFANIADLDPAIFGGIPLLQDQPTDTPAQTADKVAKRAALVAFMKSLTDPRVAAESAPFDHPELFVPQGDPEALSRIAATDADGQAAPLPNLTLIPVISPTNVDSQLISGNLLAGMSTPQVTVNGGAPIAADVSGTTWSATVTGLVEGANTILISATDTTAIPPTLITITATISLHTAPPLLTLNPPFTPTGSATQTLTGSVEVGTSVSVSINNGPAAPATVTGSFWTFTANLVIGANAIDISASDPVGNTASLPRFIIFRDPFAPPVAAADAAATGAETPKTINVLANDFGIAGAINPATVVVSAPDQPGSTAVANPEGSVTYTPAPGFTGIDSFTYTVRDSLGTASLPAVVSVSVTPTATVLGETLTVLRAQFRATGPTTGDWVLAGTTSNTAGTSALTVYLGNGTQGAVVGTAISNAGTWSLRLNGSGILPDATRTVSVVATASGASRLAFPVAVR